MTSDCGCGGGWSPEYDPYVGSTHAEWCAVYTSQLQCRIEHLDDMIERIKAAAENPDPYDRDGEAAALAKILDIIDG